MRVLRNQQDRLDRASSCIPQRVSRSVDRQGPVARDYPFRWSLHFDDRGVPSDIPARNTPRPELNYLFNQRRNLRQHVVNNGDRRMFDKASVARRDVECTQLIAENDAVRHRAREFNRETAMARERAARRDRRDELQP